MKIHKHNVLIWRPGVDEVLDGSERVAGVPLQMSLWARTFLSEGWNVYSQTQKEISFVDHNINFVHLSYPKMVVKLHLSLVYEFFKMLFILLDIRPHLFIERAPDWATLNHAVLCRILGVKFIFFSASDVNFIPGKDVIGAEKYTRLYRRSIRYIKYFITQNQFQANTLLENYGKKSMTLPNIWINTENIKSEKKYDVIWVSNLRPLKRAEWLLEVAKMHPEYSFVIVGGISHKEYYEKIDRDVRLICNVDFLGPKPVDVVNTLISESRLLACTSEYEGFPNTFIQAWAENVPVVSTVNPSNLITENNLGCVVSNIRELSSSIVDLLQSEKMYSEKQNSIMCYFHANHNADSAYKKLMAYLSVE